MLQLMKRYCSHSFRCQFSNRRCYQTICTYQVQFKYCSLNFALRATFIQLLKKLSYILKREQKL